MQATESALAVGQCALKCRHDVFNRYRFEHVHSTARQQRRVEFERRVLGGGAHEDDHAAFDEGQERILLGLVEAMHFIDEKHAATTLRKFDFSFGQRRAHIGQSRHDRGQRGESCLRIARQQQGERGLSTTGWTPKDHRMDASCFDSAAQ